MSDIVSRPYDEEGRKTWDKLFGPDRCIIQPASSRVCEHGTPGCGVQHKKGESHNG